MNLAIQLRKSFMRRLQQHNPFYFLSAACMLAGCLAVTNSLSWTSIAPTQLLILIGTLNLYEAALIGMAAYLIRRRNLNRDGVMLLVLEAFFLIDVTFLNAELATSHTVIALIVSLILFLAACVKLYFLGGLMFLRWPQRRLAAIVAQLAALFALPILFRAMDDGDLSARLFYAAWWCVGAVIPLCVLIDRQPLLAATPIWARRVARLYLSLPWLSLVLHLSILHYVYNVRFYGADVAPLLLGLTLLLNKVDPSRLLPRKDLLALRFLIPAAAVFVSLNDPAPLCKSWMTPSRLAEAGAYLTCVYCLTPRHFFRWVAAGAAAVLAWVYGPTADDVERFTWRSWCWTSDLAWRLLPKTSLQWGITAISSAFAFLGIGAAVSLGRREVVESESNDEGDEPVPGT